jgi:cation:H+ antiporter
MILVTVVTILALIPMFWKKEIGLKVGIMLAALYIISMFIMFLLPQDLALH